MTLDQIDCKLGEFLGKKILKYIINSLIEELGFKSLEYVNRKVINLIIKPTLKKFVVKPLIRFIVIFTIK